MQNQVRREIRYALGSIPLMSLPTVAVFMFEVRGYSKLYDDVYYLQLGKRQISSLGFSVLYQKCLARQNWSMHNYDVHVISGVLFTK